MPYVIRVGPDLYISSAPELPLIVTAYPGHATYNFQEALRIIHQVKGKNLISLFSNKGHFIDSAEIVDISLIEGIAHT